MAKLPPVTAASLGLVQNNLTSTTSPAVTEDASKGYAPGSSWMNQNTGEMWRCRSSTTGAARWVKVDVADHPGYVAGRYYVPFGHGTPASGVATAANTIYLIFGVIKERLTISQMGARVSTVSAGGNFQLAIYNHNPATGMPSTLVASSGSGSTAAATKVNVALAVALEPGPYWFAKNADNAASAFISQALASPSHSSLVGDAANAIVQTTGFSTASPFGTWPADLTGNTLALTTAGMNPMVDFLVASVP